MEHSLHLAAKHFVQTIAPHHTKHNTSAGDDEGDSASDSGKDNNNDNEAIDAGNSLGKAITLVKQVSHSMALLIFCANTCYRFVSHLKLGHSSAQPGLKLASCHWSSCCGFALAGGCSSAFLSVLSNSGQYVSYLSQISSRDLNLWQAITQLILLADTSKSVPKLTKHCCYADFHLTMRDWVYLTLIRDVLWVNLFDFRFPLCLLQLGAIQCPANLLVWMRAHCVVHYTQFRVSYQALGDHGPPAGVSRVERCTWWGCQEPSQMVWLCWQYIPGLFHLSR